MLFESSINGKYKLFDSEMMGTFLECLKYVEKCLYKYTINSVARISTLNCFLWNLISGSYRVADYESAIRFSKFKICKQSQNFGLKYRGQLTHGNAFPMLPFRPKILVLKQLFCSDPSVYYTSECGFNSIFALLYSPLWWGYKP